MTDFQRFRCQACAIIFTCDLARNEMRFCPIFASPATLEIASTRLTLCVACGATIPEHEARTCPRGWAPRCADCAAEKDGCRSCVRKDDWLGLLTVGIQ